MSTPDWTKECQMTSLAAASERETSVTRAARLPRKLYWGIRRRLEYVAAVISRIGRKPVQPTAQAATGALSAGDRVRVRSREEIAATLNAWSEARGCAFIDDMWDYCCTTQRVFKCVRNFIDERDYRMKRVKGLYILEGVYCQGTRVLGRCDRSCFFFWREEWLEKL